jgi:hypothetical protein
LKAAIQYGNQGYEKAAEKIGMPDDDINALLLQMESAK